MLILNCKPSYAWIIIIIFNRQVTWDKIRSKAQPKKKRKRDGRKGGREEGMEKEGKEKLEHIQLQPFIQDWEWKGFPGGSTVKTRHAKAGDAGDLGSEPWIRKIPLRRNWQRTPVFLPGKSHEQRSLASYSPRGGKESDTTEWLSMHAPDIKS